MIKVNRKIEYALIALLHMSLKTPGQLTSAKEICEAYHAPFDPTSRVLQIMAQRGILQAEQGAKGGYQITRDLTKFSLRELSDMIVGPIELVNCFHTKHINCDIACGCRIIGPMLNLNDAIRDLFGKIMVAELLESRHHAEQVIRDRYQKQTV